eukprot:12883042-Prorocentrum_lima.AAC.1
MADPFRYIGPGRPRPFMPTPEMICAPTGRSDGGVSGGRFPSASLREATNHFIDTLSHEDCQELESFAKHNF